MGVGPPIRCLRTLRVVMRMPLIYNACVSIEINSIWWWGRDVRNLWRRWRWLVVVIGQMVRVIWILRFVMAMMLMMFVVAMMLVMFVMSLVMAVAMVLVFMVRVIPLRRDWWDRRSPLVFPVGLVVNWRSSASASDLILVFFLVLVMFMVFVVFVVVFVVMLVWMIVMFMVVLLMFVAVTVMMAMGVLMVIFLVMVLMFLMVYWRWRQGLALVSVRLEPTVIVRPLLCLRPMHLTIHSNTVILTLWRQVVTMCHLVNIGRLRA